MEKSYKANSLIKHGLTEALTISVSSETVPAVPGPDKYDLRSSLLMTTTKYTTATTDSLHQTASSLSKDFTCYTPDYMPQLQHTGYYYSNFEGYTQQSYPTFQSEPACNYLQGHPWGGIASNSYEDWVTSLRKQYQVYGKVR